MIEYGSDQGRIEPEDKREEKHLDTRGRDPRARIGEVPCRIETWADG